MHCSVAPVIPAVTDEFMEGIVERAGALGVPSAGWIPLRLPYEVAPLFRARFRLARKRAGIRNARVELDCDKFRAPVVGGQLPLL